VLRSFILAITEPLFRFRSCSTDDGEGHVIAEWAGGEVPDQKSDVRIQRSELATCNLRLFLISTTAKHISRREP